MKRFFLDMLSTFNPKKYRELIQNKVGYCFKYLALLLLVSFLLMSALAIPKLIIMPSYLTEKFASFDHVTVSINQSMNSPLVIADKVPQIVVDTRDNVSIGKEKVLLTKDSLYYKQLLSVKHINLSEYKELTRKKEEMSNFMLYLTILAMPSILIVSYIIYFVKYLALAAIFSIVTFVICRLIKFDLSFRKLFKISIYSITVMALLEILLLPFSVPMLSLTLIPPITINLIPLILYLILFAAASYTIGEKELVIRHARHH